VPFPRRLLNEGEEVVLDLRPHWWELAGPSVALVAAIALAVAVASQSDRGYIRIPFLVLVLLALVWFLDRALGRRPCPGGRRPRRPPPSR
jgi:hypothetical protein